MNKMPKQNRVTPFGDIVSVPERGTFMGNRGVLHDENAQIKRSWQVKRWIVCVLEFRNRKRTVMTPDRYTELFFLDEATAFAAGHRPCAECRRSDFLVFCEAWRKVNPSEINPQRPKVEEIDNRLHSERVNMDRSKRSYMGNLAELPNGVFVTVPGWGDQAYLVWGKYLLEWSPGGYQEERLHPRKKDVTILTPKSLVEVIRAGYDLEIHPSAEIDR